MLQKLAIKAQAASMARQERTDEGASAVEYGLLLGGVAVVVAGAVVILGPQLESLFDTVTTTLGEVPGVGEGGD